MHNNFLLCLLTILLVKSNYGIVLQEEDPVNLLTFNRFDIAAKYIYAKINDLQAQTVWGTEVYLEHLRVLNNFYEDKTKQGPEAFLKSFDDTLSSIKQSGFNSTISVVPVGGNSIVDGAHRVSACLLHRKKVITNKVSDKDVHFFTAEFFKNFTHYVKNGLAQQYIDAMAIQYAELKKNTFLLFIFPSVSLPTNHFKNIISKYSTIVYEKTVQLTNNGPLLLIQHLYENEPWIGTWNNNFSGARAKTNRCFPEKSTGLVRIFLVEANDLDTIKKCKNELRSLFKIDNDSVHTTDTNEQTISVARMVYNDNSIHFLNNAQLKKLHKFEEYLMEYKQWLTNGNYEQSYFCIDGSAVMAAYGLRDCNDLDFVHFGYDALELGIPNHPLLTSHNQEIKYHAASRDELIFNPNYYFYFKDVKFVSLKMLKKMKEKRNEIKDQQDVILMNTIFKTRINAQ